MSANTFLMIEIKLEKIRLYYRLVRLNELFRFRILLKFI